MQHNRILLVLIMTLSAACGSNGVELEFQGKRIRTRSFFSRQQWTPEQFRIFLGSLKQALNNPKQSRADQSTSLRQVCGALATEQRETVRLQLAGFLTTLFREQAATALGRLARSALIAEGARPLLHFTRVPPGQRDSAYLQPYLLCQATGRQAARIGNLLIEAGIYNLIKAEKIQKRAAAKIVLQLVLRFADHTEREFAFKRLYPKFHWTKDELPLPVAAEGQRQQHQTNKSDYERVLKALEE